MRGAYAQNSPQIPIPYTNWVATDGLGRTLPQSAETGPPRAEKYVGLFYYLWHGEGTGNTIYDNTVLINANPGNPAYGPEQAFHWWGKPEAGYYKSSDPWVIRRNLQMLAVAGVDFVFFDVTNGFEYLNVVNAIMGVSRSMRNQGLQTPRIAFCTYSNSGKVMNDLYDKLYADKTNQDLWFMWEGKPLILGNPADPGLRPSVKSFFSIKYSWAWTDAKNTPNQWQWIDTYPQDYGWQTDKTVAEQIPVAKASHPTNDQGDSYSAGAEPALDNKFLTPYTGQGRFFTEQWKRALQVDPKLVMVTQWNEWIAQRFVATTQTHPEFLGRTIPLGATYFVDDYNQEFNRDIEPMEGGHGDNHYYLMVDRIRRFKGMSAPEGWSGNMSIAIDGSFADWAKVGPVYQDPQGDVAHRDFDRFDTKARYTNVTGRNDIIEARTALDADNVAFYAKTASALSPYTAPNWMQLFIDADQNQATGWAGFDFAVNATMDRTDKKTALCRWSGSAWQKVADVDYRYAGSEIEIAIPRSLLGLTAAQPAFQFQWADNAQSGGDIAVFGTDGDAAPDRRFRYAFAAKIGTAIHAPGAAASPSLRSISWKLGTQSGSIQVALPAGGLGRDAAAGGDGRVQVRLLDSQGRAVWDKSMLPGESAALGGDSNLPVTRGLYWIQVRSGAAMATSGRLLLMDRDAGAEAGEIRLD